MNLKCMVIIMRMGENIVLNAYYPDFREARNHSPSACNVKVHFMLGSSSMLGSSEVFFMWRHATAPPNPVMSILTQW